MISTRALAAGTDSSVGIGGDFALDWVGIQAGTAAKRLFATGRDALAAIVRDKPGVWLVADFTCPAVPAMLQKCGCVPTPYPWLDPWTADLSRLKEILPRARGIVVPFYMGLPPDGDIWEAVPRVGLCVVEDRCQSVGPPPSPREMRGDFAIGSYRKWLATPDGAYCVAARGAAPRPSRLANLEMVRLRLAAALLRHVRATSRAASDPSWEDAQVSLFAAGEAAADGQVLGACASGVSERLVREADFAAIRRRRVANQAILAAGLADTLAVRVLQPRRGTGPRRGAPLLALPVLCRDRNRLRTRLTRAGVYCAVHWKDGNWSGATGPARRLAASVLSLPIDQRYGSSDMKRIIALVREWKS